jgi:hypothetical protein
MDGPGGWGAEEKDPGGAANCRGGRMRGGRRRGVATTEGQAVSLWRGTYALWVCDDTAVYCCG